MLKKKILLSTLFFLSALITLAQSKTITGKVLSNNGLPLTGATIALKKSATIVASDNEGSYSINVQINNACGNTSNQDINILVPDNRIYITTNTVDAQCHMADGKAIAVITGGNSPYNYVWNPGTVLNDSLLSNPTATTIATLTLALTVTDSLGCSGTDTMVLYINDPPVAADDTITGFEDSLIVINILQNDTDINNNIDTASISIVAGPFNGSVTIDTITGLITYTPVANYNGVDSMQYSICDHGLPVYCDTAWVFINILPVNDPPVANDDFYITMEDICITFNVLANDTDVENDINLATFNITWMPSHGTITLDTIVCINGCITIRWWCDDSDY